MVENIDMPISELDTPSLIVDLDKMEKNIALMAERISAINPDVGLRPHLKTHKTPEVSRMQLKYGAKGITAAKLSEVEVFIKAGFDNILIANEIIGPKKAAWLVELAKTANISSCVDSEAGVRMLAEQAEKGGVQLNLFLDVNTGLDRAGCSPEEAVELGKLIAGFPSLNLKGVFSYAGYKPKLPDAKRIEQWALQEAETAVGIADELSGITGRKLEVSVAGTPSSIHAAAVKGVTEVRPGTYVFYDTNYLKLGICSPEQCALEVLAQVVSRPSADRAVINAGSKTISPEKLIINNEDTGFGFIRELPRTILTSMWEEHGVLKLDEDGRQLRVGDTIRIIPNHVCTTVNLHDRWFGCRNGQVEKVFSIPARGKVQ